MRILVVTDGDLQLVIQFNFVATFGIFTYGSSKNATFSVGRAAR